jgi:hypothetical protein
MVMNLPDSVKWRESHEWLSNYWLLKKDSGVRPVAEVGRKTLKARPHKRVNY